MLPALRDSHGTTERTTCGRRVRCTHHEQITNGAGDPPCRLCTEGT